ncbi:MAG: hypothetical protein U0521_03270 [Anaerolineae bacterium]
MQPDGTGEACPDGFGGGWRSRRAYTQSHVDYLAEVLVAIYHQREKVPGHCIVWQALFLRHFTVRMELDLSASLQTGKTAQIICDKNHE